MNRNSVLVLESSACQRIVALGGGSSTRSLVAKTLRAWRSLGDFDRARWFLRHAFFISGYLYKDSAATLRADLPALTAKS